MASTLLQLIQATCKRSNLPVPTGVVMTSREATWLQLVEILNELVEELVHFSWQMLKREAVFTSVNADNQGSIQVLAPFCVRILNDTIYDRTRKLPIFGPKTAEEWQAFKALPMTNPYAMYRIMEGKLWTIPNLPEGHTIAFEYTSSAAVVDAEGTYKKAFTQDTDTCVFDDALLVQGLRYKFKAEKGFDYALDYERFMQTKKALLSSDGVKPVLHMDGVSKGIMPGIFVPIGNIPVGGA